MVGRRDLSVPDHLFGKWVCVVSTFQKWQRNLDHEHQKMMTWLNCNTEKQGVKKVVAKAEMQSLHWVCGQIRGRKNFSDNWFVGAHSVQISNTHDDARNDQCAHAMKLLEKVCSKSAGLGPSSSTPIAQAFNKLGYDEREKLQVKFDKAYFVATENVPYTKHPKICELHGDSPWC